jgi:hypothetical protein
LARKKKETYILLFWFIPLLLYLSFGSSSFTQYLPFIAKARYLTIITIPGILLLAFFLVGKGHFIKRVAMSLALILLLTSVVSVYLREDRNLLDNLNIVSPYLKGLDKPIYMDSRSIKVLDYILKYKNEIDARRYTTDLKIIKDAYILVNKDMIRRLKESNNNTKFPVEIDNPLENWKITKEIGKGENRIIIYFAS